MSEEPTLDLESGLWMSLSEVAELKGISRQALSKRVAKLEAEGLLQTKPGGGGTKLINVAQYDRVIGAVGDAIKEIAAETVKETAPDAPAAAPALRDAQTRSAQYTADLKFIELNEKIGALVPVADVADAATRAGEAIIRVIDRLPSHADVLAAAAGKDGIGAVRSELKSIARDLRQSIADAFTAMAGTAKPVTLDTVAEAEP